MKLSIIIPVYNVEKYISRCLDSLITQDLDTHEYEVLIINDGSEDKSVEIASEYSIEHPNFKVITQLNGGVGSARNKGISLAQGKYVYFIDPDDYLAANMLNILIEYSEYNVLDILTFSSEKTLDSKLLETKTEDIEDINIKVQTGTEYISNKSYQNEVWWYLIKREFLVNSKIKFIEGRWMEDAIFTAQIFLKAKRMAYLPIDVHRHVITPQSAMTSKESGHYLRVIRDNANAAEVFQFIIKDIDLDLFSAKACIKRLKSRQQSFVFFMMVRMLKSTIKLKEIKSILNSLESIGAYPLNSFVGKDYNKITYIVLAKLFNFKYVYYFLFRIFNPVLKRI